ncbi:LytTR family DNA-binding domain-containing protein [Winogradskyella sp.]|uniref:LytR/AlgR family response regulator transcription factor n=1 Tax=Winogradskyella sp. TaxID=1883156 RepID=UPI0026232D9A|nr:LytTR family DNA-binding domain-containing protein [Winogradskyella sp.]
MYKAIIVDDQPSNVEILKIYLQDYFPSIHIAGEANSIESAIKSCYKHNPDILFLDIKLTDDDSFMLLDSIDIGEKEVVMVRSYETYGAKAVNHDITGYMVKPIDVKNLQLMVNKIIRNIEKKRSLDVGYKKPEDEPKSYLDILAIPTTSKIEMILAESIVYIEADGRYTIFHLHNGESKIASRNLGEYKTALNPKHFFRIHRRYIVNLSMIVNINKSAGNYCKMINDLRLPIARRRLDELLRRLKIK